jgi:hypothetical protein
MSVFTSGTGKIIASSEYDIDVELSMEEFTSLILMAATSGTDNELFEAARLIRKKLSNSEDKITLRIFKNTIAIANEVIDQQENKEKN